MKGGENNEEDEHGAGMVDRTRDLPVFDVSVVAFPEHNLASKSRVKIAAKQTLSSVRTLPDAHKQDLWTAQ